MPYKRKEDKAAQMRKYRLRKNPTKRTFHAVKRIFTRAFVFGMHYPNLPNDFQSEVYWIYQFQKNPYHNSSVKVETKEIHNLLDIIDELFWRILYESDRRTLKKSVPEKDRKMIQETQIKLHNLYKDLSEGKIEFTGILPGASIYDYPLPIDELISEE